MNSSLVTLSMFFLFFTVFADNQNNSLDPNRVELQRAAKPTTTVVNGKTEMNQEVAQPVTYFESFKSFVSIHGGRIITVLATTIAWLYIKQPFGQPEQQVHRHIPDARATKEIAENLKAFNNSVNAVVTQGNFEGIVNLNDESHYAKNLEKAAHDYVLAAYKVRLAQQELQRNSEAQRQRIFLLEDIVKDRKRLYEKAFFEYAQSKGIQY